MECKNLKTITVQNPECEIYGHIAAENNIPSTAEIHGYTGSTAEEYANTYGRTFIPIDSGTVTTTTAITTTTTTTTITTTQSSQGPTTPLPTTTTTTDTTTSSDTTTTTTITTTSDYTTTTTSTTTQSSQGPTTPIPTTTTTTSTTTSEPTTTTTTTTTSTTESTTTTTTTSTTESTTTTTTTSTTESTTTTTTTESTTTTTTTTTSETITTETTTTEITTTTTTLTTTITTTETSVTTTSYVTTLTTITTTSITTTTATEYIMKGKSGGVSYKLCEKTDGSAQLELKGEKTGTELTAVLWSTISAQLTAVSEYDTIELILDNVGIEESTFGDDKIGIHSKVKSVSFLNIDSIPKSPFGINNSIECVTITDQLKTISDFAGFTGIESVYLLYKGEMFKIAGNSVDPTDEVLNAVMAMQLESIGRSSFYNCPELKSFILPPDITLGIEAIGYNAGETATFITPDMCIYGWNGSPAQEYAASNYISFIAVDILTGDVNGDSLINITDAAEALTIYARNAAGLSTDDYTSSQKSAADIDCDGKITIGDATAILIYYAQKAAGIETSWEKILMLI